MPQIKVVEATGIASASNASGNSDLASQIEAAMQQALRECLDQGVTDPEEQRARMLVARDAVIDAG